MNRVYGINRNKSQNGKLECRFIGRQKSTSTKRNILTNMTYFQMTDNRALALLIAT